MGFIMKMIIFIPMLFCRLSINKTIKFSGGWALEEYNTPAQL